MSNNIVRIGVSTAHVEMPNQDVAALVMLGKAKATELPNKLSAQYGPMQASFSRDFSSAAAAPTGTKWSAPVRHESRSVTLERELKKFHPICIWQRALTAMSL